MSHACDKCDKLGDKFIPMIKKIEEEGDIEHLEIGTILTKYPTSGEFSEQIDFTNHGNLLQYQIHSMDRDAQIFQLKMPDRDALSPDPLAGIYHLEAADQQPPVLNKSFQDLITDKIWWYEQ